MLGKPMQPSDRVVPMLTQEQPGYSCFWVSVDWTHCMSYGPLICGWAAVLLRQPGDSPGEYLHHDLSSRECWYLVGGNGPVPKEWSNGTTGVITSAKCLLLWGITQQVIYVATQWSISPLCRGHANRSAPGMLHRSTVEEKWRTAPPSEYTEIQCCAAKTT